MKKFKDISEQYREEGRHKLIYPKNKAVVTPRPESDSAKAKLGEAIKDKFDIGEYDQEGDMAKSDLRSIIANAKRVHDMLEDDDNLPEWVQSKITKAEDYMSTVANYMEAEMNEEVVQESGGEVVYKKGDHHIEKYGEDAFALYVNGKKQKFYTSIEKAKSAIEEEVEQLDEKNKPTNPELWSRAISMAKSKFDVYPSAYANGWAAKWYKSKGGGWRSVSEEVEQIDEGRPSQRHPLEGHEYHKKTDAELVHIAKDAHEAAEAMKSHNTAAENKYRDQANDSATVRHFRKTSGMPNWYKKKYGHMNEEVEQIDELKKSTLASYATKASDDAKNKKDAATSYAAQMKGYSSKGMQKSVKADKRIEGVKKAVSRLAKEETDTLPFTPDKPKKQSVVAGKYGSGYSTARHLARQAMQKQVEKMKKPPIKEESKKAAIVKDIMKKKKDSEKFESDPVLSSTVTRNT